MFPATTEGGGQCVAFPDVCKTPAPPAPAPVPIPYPNMGMCSSLKPVAKKVKIKNKHTGHKKSKIKSSTGDEPGLQKGMISNKTKGEIKRSKGVSKVKVQKKPIITTLQPTSHNKNNAPPGAQVAPSQTKVIITAF